MCNWSIKPFVSFSGAFGSCGDRALSSRRRPLLFEGGADAVDANIASKGAIALISASLIGSLMGSLSASSDVSLCASASASLSESLIELLIGGR